MNFFSPTNCSKRVPISVSIVFISSLLTVSHISKWNDGARQTEISSSLKNINSPGTFPDFLLSPFLLHHLSERGNNQPRKLHRKCKKAQTVSGRRDCRRVFSTPSCRGGSLQRMTTERRGGGEGEARTVRREPPGAQGPTSFHSERFFSRQTLCCKSLCVSLI